jgi:hypothetical protein
MVAHIMAHKWSVLFGVLVIVAGAVCLWIWKRPSLKTQRRRAELGFDKRRTQLLKNKASRDELAEHEADEYYTLREYDIALEHSRASKLVQKATALDVELPDRNDKEMWSTTDDGEFSFLSAKGRAYARKLVHEEQMRQFDLRYGYFIKIVIPLFGLLFGLLGAFTGLLSVLHHQSK